MGTKPASILQSFLHPCLKTQKQQLHFVKNSDRALYNRAGRKTVRAGSSAFRNMPSWNTGLYHDGGAVVCGTYYDGGAALCGTYRDDGAAVRGTYHDGGATWVLDAQPERRVAPVHLVEEADLDDVLVDGAVLVPQPHALRQLHRLQQPLVLNTRSRPVRHR